jgi:SAM-dependent methyltransferase
MSGVDLDTGVPHSARIYDYLLGGRDNFPADRAAADAITRDWPHLPVSMRANRRFMARLVRHLAAERGLRQFLDIGSGLPTSPNLHEVVRAVAPDARVVYVDNDPLVIAQGRARLGDTAHVVYLDADLNDADAILASAEVRDTLDLSRPVALSLIAILQFVVDEDRAHSIIERLLAPLAPGSMLALSTVTADSAPGEVTRGTAAYVARGIDEKPRDRAEVTALFGGRELLDPGVVLVSHWHPAPGDDPVPDEYVHMYGGVAIKP